MTQSDPWVNRACPYLPKWMRVSAVLYEAVDRRVADSPLEQKSDG